MLVPFLLVPLAAAEPPAPPPSVALTVAQESDTRWRMRVENRGPVPVRLAADARLLSLDVTAPGAKKALHCVLPADMRPANGYDRELVLPPQRAFAETFDPRLYCFGAKEEAALVPGASVVAHLGWPAPARAQRLTSPFVLEPIEGVTPPVAPAKEIASAPWTIAALAPTPTPTPTPYSDETPDKLEVSSLPHEDAERGVDVSVAVTVANRGTRAVTVLVRPETLAFDVQGPGGAVRCGGTRAVDAPIRELYTTLAPGTHTSVRLLLDDMCPDKTFDRAGLYVVRALLDTRRASARGLGVRTFDGVAVAPVTTQVRIRQARKPSLPPRPALE